MIKTTKMAMLLMFQDNDYSILQRAIAGATYLVLSV